MAHFSKNFNEIMIMSLGYAKDIMTVKLISKEKKRSLHLKFTGTGPYDCPCGPVFLKLIQHANPFSKYTEVRGPPMH